MTVCAVVTIVAVQPQLYTLTSRLLPFVLMALLLSIVAGASLTWRKATACVAVGTGFGIAFWLASTPPVGIAPPSPSSLLGAAKYSLEEMARNLTSAGGLWVTAWVMWRVLRRTPDDFTPREVRYAASMSLIIGSCVAIFVIALTAAIHRDFPSPYKYQQPLIMVTTVGGLVAAAPWIKLLRGHARRLQGGHQAWDTVSKLLLGLGIGFAAFSWLTAGLWYLPPGLLVRPDDPVRGLGLAIILIFLYTQPQWIGVALFVAGLVLELYRDRWHPRLTVLGCAYFVPFWLFVAVEPSILERPGGY
jgi:hypothetical protein